MTKRLTLVGFALVAAVWGPYVYAELVRQPLEVESDGALQPVIIATPVAYLPAAAGRLEQASSASTQPLAAVELPEAPAEPPLPAAEPEPEPELDEAEPAHAAEEAELQPTAAVTTPAAAVEPPTAAEPTAAEPAAAEPPPPPSEPSEAPEPAAPAEPEAAQPAEASAADTAGPKAADGVGAIPEELVPAVRSAFDQESRDVTWASREEPRITKVLSGVGVPSHAISEVRCQSTVCRVAFNAGQLESAAQSQLYQRVREQLGPAVALDSTSQEQHAAFYVLRLPQ